MQSMIVTALSFPENFFNNFKRKYQKQVNAPSMDKVRSCGKGAGISGQVNADGFQLLRLSHPAKGCHSVPTAQSEESGWENLRSASVPM